MAWLTAIAFVGILSFFVAEHSQRLSKDKRSKLRRWYLGWLLKGAVAPAAVWIFFNVGLLHRVPSLMIDVELAPAGAPRVVAALNAIGLGLFAIATYWAALTAGWLLLALYRQSEIRADFRAQVLTWSLVLVPLALFIALHWGWYYVGLAGAIWLLPLLQIVESFSPEPVTRPSYSRAVARMQFDKYEEAESAVIDELEKCEDDFDGWMLLAELYAVHFHDMSEAERTIRETCGQSATTDSQRSVALHKLADWHLKFSHDPVAARRDLAEICHLLPGTHLARMANLRLKQLPETPEEWSEQQKGKTYHLPALRRDLDSSSSETSVPGPAPADALLLAKRLSERLHRNPNDASDREELARLLAENLNKVDAGLEQLELLLTMPDQPDQKLSEWLALMASWQFKFKHDEAAARKIIERLIHQFPQSPAAFAGQRRLNLMDLEAKLRATRASPQAQPKISLLPS